MNRALRRLNVKLKALLCVALIMNLSFWTVGCGQMAMEMPDGSFRIALTPGHPLTSHLQGSAFEGASAIEIKPGGQEFRLIFPDGAKEISGTFSDVSGQLEVTSLTMSQGSQSATLELDASSKCITSISTSTGHRWERPAEWGTPEIVGDGADAYLEANHQLMEMAEELDDQQAFSGGSSTGDTVSDEDGQTGTSPEKPGQVAFGPVAAIFFVPGVILLCTAGVGAALVWVLQLINLIF